MRVLKNEYNLLLVFVTTLPLKRDVAYVTRIVNIFFMNIHQFLKNIYLFQSLSDSEIKKIASFSLSNKIKKDTLLFHEKDAAKAFFVIGYGKVKIFKTSPRGDEQILHIQTQNDLVAEAAIFDQETYPASAQTIEDSLLVSIPKKDFLNYLNTHPQIAIKLLSAYSKRLREFVGMIEYLSLNDIKERLVKFLIKNAVTEGDKTYCPLNITKREIAMLLGTSPETLSRALNYLKKNQIITEQGKKLIINNTDKLQTLITK
jgi:CRP/FNR family transcriptional regulator, dissimilatory nitrate respiration regulator